MHRKCLQLFQLQKQQNVSSIALKSYQNPFETIRSNNYFPRSNKIFIIVKLDKFDKFDKFHKFEIGKMMCKTAIAFQLLENAKDYFAIAKKRWKIDRRRTGTCLDGALFGLVVFILFCICFKQSMHIFETNISVELHKRRLANDKRNVYIQRSESHFFAHNVSPLIFAILDSAPVRALYFSWIVESFTISRGRSMRLA